MSGSACDECARNGIIESEGSKCPVCGEVANPEELIPYRLFRDKVDRFRNQTGYTKPATAAPVTLPPMVSSLAVKPTLPDIVLPDPTDTNFKFDNLVGHRAAPGSRVEPPNLNFTLTTTSVPPPSLSVTDPVSSSDVDTPASKTPGTPGTPIADSPSYEMLGPRSPHTPTSTPPRSPSTPRSRRSRSRSRDRSYSSDRRSPAPVSHKSPPAPAVTRPVIDTSVPPPMFSTGSAPPLTLLPPGHVLSHAPPSYPPPQPHMARVTPAPYSHPPAVINPSEDPLAAFEAAMRKLDSKKAGRGRSPPRAYQDRHRSRSRERYKYLSSSMNV